MTSFLRMTSSLEVIPTSGLGVPPKQVPPIGGSYYSREASLAAETPYTANADKASVRVDTEGAEAPLANPAAVTSYGKCR